MRIFSTLVVTPLAIAALTACAAQRPVLYPNEKLRTAGQAQAEQAVEQCVELAQAQEVDSNQGGDVAADTATDSVVGAASGAAVGAVLGDAATGAAAGAAGGASRGLIRALISKREPDPVFREFVDRCLREKGYEPIGWK